jgi:hypothetical protein
MRRDVVGGAHLLLEQASHFTSHRQTEWVPHRAPAVGSAHTSWRSAAMLRRSVQTIRSPRRTSDRSGTDGLDHSSTLETVTGREIAHRSGTCRLA